jgi:hypothetical protein
MPRSGLNHRDTNVELDGRLRSPRGTNVSRRIATAAAILLLLVQAVPVLACVAMPTQALATCCCEPDRDCAMGHDANGCATADSCCAQASGSSPALSNAAAHPDERAFAALPTVAGAPPAGDPLVFIEQRASLAAAHLFHQASAPLPAVPLYLRHLRLTL